MKEREQRKSAWVPKPWYVIVEEVRDEQDMTQEALAIRARDFGAAKGLTGSYIGRIARDERPLTANFLEAIAWALGVQPTDFFEYRLVKLAEYLSPPYSDLRQAWERFGALSTVPMLAPSDSSELPQDMQQGAIDEVTALVRETDPPDPPANFEPWEAT